MQTRSKGNHNLLPYQDNINQQNRNQRVQQEQVLMADGVGHEQGAAVQRQPRNIGAGDAPNTHTQRQGIVPPAIQNNNFEIKSSLISMIQGNRFHGLPMEDPLDHLDEFDRLCGLTKINGVSEDAFKLRLFPFSLGDKAHVWEKGLPNGSITTWDDCKRVFLSKFFSSSRTARLRNEISSFTQKNGESFAEAWERFKTSTSRCPHHGFTDQSLLSTLYRGVLPKYRMLLDTASNGNFLNKDVDEGKELVENLAQADGTYNEDHDRSIRGSSDAEERHRKEIKALNDKLDKLLQVQQKQVHFASEDEVIQIQDGEESLLEEVSYVQNQGGYNKNFNNYKANPNLSYRSTNVANPRDQVYPPQQQSQNTNFNTYNQSQGYVTKQPFSGGYQQQQPPVPPGFLQPQLSSIQDPALHGFLQQLLQIQTSSASETSKQLADMKTHIACTYNALNNQIETINSRLQHLESQSASSSTQIPGQLPGKAVQNPKDFSHAKVVTICSDPVTPPLQTTPILTGDSEIQDGEAFSPNESPFGSSYIRLNHMVQPTPENPLDHHTRSYSSSQLAQSLDRILQAKHTEQAPPEEKNDPIIPPTYVPKLPFPGRKKKQLLEEYKIKLEQQLVKIEDAAFLTEALKNIPSNDQRMIGLVLERIKEIQSSKAATQDSNTETATKVIHMKLADPGSFTLPCSLGPLMFGKCLCDLGASVNLMPLSVAQKLGFSKYKPSKVSLMLADRSVRHPHGLLEDLPLRVGHVEVPTDFVVLDMDDDPNDPLILGRPFLATAGARIDVKKGKIDLDFGEGLVLKFDINENVEKPTINGQLFSIEENEPTAVTNNPPIHSDSIEIPRDIVEHNQRRSQEWVELKERSKWQDNTIRSLMNTVVELKSQVKMLEVQVSNSSSGKEEFKKGSSSLAFSGNTNGKMPIEWIWENNYPPDQMKFGIEEEIIENICCDLSRENVELEDQVAREVKRTSVPPQQPP